MARKQYNKDTAKAEGRAIKRMQKSIPGGKYRELQHGIKMAGPGHSTVNQQRNCKPGNLFMQKNSFLLKNIEEASDLDHYNIEDVEKILIKSLAEAQWPYYRVQRENWGSYTDLPLYRRIGTVYGALSLLLSYCHSMGAVGSSLIITS